MTEAEARRWVRDRWGSETEERLAVFAELVITENAKQNLIAPSTVSTIWVRHIVDSLQLLPLAGVSAKRWLDIGSGGGFPGMAIAIASGWSMLLVEPRRRRADFLRECCQVLNVAEVKVHACKVEQVETQADVITARAVATVENLLRAAAHCATASTRWLLPRGSIDMAALPMLLRRYHLVFHVEQSLTHPDSAILVLNEPTR